MGEELFDSGVDYSIILDSANTILSVELRKKYYDMQWYISL